MAHRYLLLLIEGDYDWIQYNRSKEVTSLTNPYYDPEGTIEAIEFDPAKLNEVLTVLGKERKGGTNGNTE